MEDEEIIRDFLQEKLKTMGYQVILTSNGEEVLKVVADQGGLNQFSAMIFDLTIQGGMGGRELVQKIRELDQKIPVFVASGYSSDPIMSNPREYGFTAALHKPFSSFELSNILDRYIDSEI
jgi:CheY-like chemotaxis protein